MLREINEYFKTEMTGLDANEWDEVEEEIGKIVKSARAGTNFKGNMMN